MEIAFFVLGIVAVLGGFSLYQNGQKNKVIMKVIQDYLAANNSKLVKVEVPQDSGPFNDAYYDKAQQDMYSNLGYRSKETVYRQVAFQTSNGENKWAWLQLRLESMKATYVEWKE